MSVYRYGATIPDFVRRFRLRNGLLQTDLGSRMGVTKQYISNVERGVHRAPVSFCTLMVPLLDKKEMTHLLDLLSESCAEQSFERMKRKTRKMRQKRK